MATLTAEVLPQAGGTGKHFIANILFDEQKFLVPGKVFVPLDAELGVIVRNLIAAGTEVLLTQEQVDDPGDLTYDDLEIVTASDLDNDKKQEIFRLRNRLSFQMANMAAIDFYGFFTAFSELLVKGYNINDSNRDQVYLDIVDGGDEDTIALLQTYVETSDKISTFSDLYKWTNETIASIEAAATQEEFDQITDSYSF